MEMSNVHFAHSGHQPHMALRILTETPPSRATCKDQRICYSLSHHSTFSCMPKIKGQEDTVIRSVTAFLLASVSSAMAAGVPVDSDPTFSSNPKAAFETGTEKVDGPLSESIFIRSLIDGDQDRQIGDLSRWLPADSYQRKRIRISTKLKTSVAGRATCTLAAWDDRRALQTADGASRSGSGDWQDCSVVMQIPDGATRLRIGFYLRGRGEVWADQFSLEEVGRDVPETHRPIANMDRGSDDGRSNRAINSLGGFGDN